MSYFYRLKKIPNIRGLPIDVRTRHVKLLEMEGWYNATPQLPPLYEYYYKQYKESKCKLKFTRWLLRNTLLEEKQVSAIGKMLVQTSFKLSCRHNDFLRLSDTPHFKSCLKDNNFYGRQRLHFLSDPDMALLYIPDASGKFVWRCLIRLVQYRDSLALVRYRVYGNGPSSSIFTELSKYIPVLTAVDIKLKKTTLPTTWLPSPTVHNNPMLFRPVWTDHQMKSSGGRLYIRVYDTDTLIVEETYER